MAASIPAAVGAAASSSLMALPTVVLRCACPSLACSMTWLQLQKLRETRNFLLSRHDSYSSETTSKISLTPRSVAETTPPSSTVFKVPRTTKVHMSLDILQPLQMLNKTNAVLGPREGSTTSLATSTSSDVNQARPAPAEEYKNPVPALLGPQVSVEVCGEAVQCITQVPHLLDLAEEAARCWEPVITKLRNKASREIYNSAD
ncbi:unnamed protein product [Amoebophrya sp. A120]|nr:unnamed protein product [Amoebophrya sp. A120]|eukprot:GSA120T00001509001.1